MTSRVRKSPIPVIVGPTASGKSDLAIELALRIKSLAIGAARTKSSLHDQPPGAGSAASPVEPPNIAVEASAGKGATVAEEIAIGSCGEIINMDSVQVYRGLYIATAKVPVEERRGVPHHLVDIAEPAENFTAGEYARRAAELIREIEDRGNVPILAGGTGFYLRALVRPLFESPPTDLRLRTRLKESLDRFGPEHLHKMLKRVDPSAAGKLSPRDWSRTMRALEYRFQTGRPISHSQPVTGTAPELADRIVVIALSPPREKLYAKINARADAMFERGLVEEVQALIDSGVPPDAKAFQAHGYKRVVEYIQEKISKEQALEQMKLDTRHYAKRQWTWWRAWPNVHWINRFGDDPEAIKEAIDILEALAVRKLV